MGIKRNFSWDLKIFKEVLLGLRIFLSVRISWGMRQLRRLIDGRGEVVDLACLVTLALDTIWYMRYIPPQVLFGLANTHTCGL